MYVLISLLTLMVVYVLYKCSTRNFKYWKERGVPYIKPVPIFGNVWKICTFRSQIGHFLRELYNENHHPYFGIFILNKPNLVVKCPDLIKSILTKDFHYFPDRPVISDEKSDPIGSKFLFLVKSPEWKYLRYIMAPAFSVAKLKGMITLINGVAEDLKEYLRKHSHKHFLETKEIFIKYSADVTATCAFGINGNCFKNEDAEFRKMAELVFQHGWKISAIQAYGFMMPSIVEFLQLPFFNPKFTDFVKNVFWETFNERKKSKHKRNDLIDVLLQTNEKVLDGEEFKFEDNRITAIAGQFFAASVESTSSVTSFILYELSLQPDIQKKLREEIKCVLEKHEEISYQTLSEMSYLHMVINEALRKYPTLPFLDRLCVQDYKVPNSDLVIEKGTKIYIPTFGLHYDSKYFPDPEKFDPERFSEENKNSFPEYAFIPFGKGPRSCIGARLGFLGIQLGLVHTLSEFEVELTSRTPVPLVYKQIGFLLESEHGIPLKFNKLTS